MDIERPEGRPILDGDARLILQALGAHTGAMNLETLHPGVGLERVITDPEFWETHYSAWDWGPGVAIVGLYESSLASDTDDEYQIARRYWEHHRSQGLPDFKINTMLPYLTCLWMDKVSADPQALDIAVHAGDWCVSSAPLCANGAWNHSGLYFEWDEQLWIDTVFVAGRFLFELTRRTGDRVYADSAIRQILLHAEVLLDPLTRLYRHGFNVREASYMSDVRWARGNAWMAIMLVDAIEFARGAERERLVALASDLVTVLISRQDASGFWRTVLTSDSAPLEASASAGFARAIGRAVRSSIVDEGCLASMDRALGALMRVTSGTGQLFGTSAGTGVLESESAYHSIPLHAPQPWGQGLAMMAWAERVTISTGFDIGGVAPGATASTL